MLVETLNDELLLLGIGPQELFVQKTLEVDRTHFRDDLCFSIFTKVIRNIAVHQKEYLLISEGVEGLLLVEMCEFVLGL